MEGLRAKWAANQVTAGLWLSLPGTVSAEVAARSPVDYVCVDMQHGVIDYQASASMVQTIELAGGVPLIRVPWNDPGIIGKSLDSGAHGVIVPMVNTREEAAAVVRSARYAPAGSRSWGPVMAGLRHADNRAWADETVVVIPMIETIEAVDNIDQILAVPGIDAIYVGPADLSLSLGLEPASNDGDPRFDTVLANLVAACRRHSVVPGIHATGALVGVRRRQGFRMITVTSDLLAMRSGFSTELSKAGSAEPSTAPAY